MYSKSPSIVLTTKPSQQLETLRFVKDAKAYSTLRVKLMQKTPSGNVSSVISPIRSTWMTKKNQRQRLSLILLKPQLKLLIKKWLDKIYLLFFVLMSQVQCASLSQLKVNLTLKETVEIKILRHSLSLATDLISLCKHPKKVLHMSPACNACRLLCKTRQIRWLKGHRTVKQVLSHLTTRLR